MIHNNCPSIPPNAVMHLCLRRDSDPQHKSHSEGKFHWGLEQQSPLHHYSLTSKKT